MQRQKSHVYLQINTEAANNKSAEQSYEQALGQREEDDSVFQRVN